MLFPLLIFASGCCVGLFAALRPEEWIHCFLAESQRKALSGNLKLVSLIGWVICCSCIVVLVAIPFQSKWYLLAPVIGPLFFLVCAVAYSWWGIGLLRKPESSLKRAIEPWNRSPKWFIKGLGSLLLLVAIGFLYGFAVRIREFLR